FEDLFRKRIASGCSLGDHFAAYGFNFPIGQGEKSCAILRRFGKFFLCAASYRGSRREDFDAALFLAIAGWAVQVNGNVAAFRGGTRAAVKDFSIENDSSADAGAYCGEENIPITVARSPEIFREASGVCVVVEFHCGGKVLCDCAGQRIVTPAGHVRRIDDDPGPRIERAGSTDSNALNFLVAARAFFLQLLNRGDDG